MIDILYLLIILLLRLEIQENNSGTPYFNKVDSFQSPLYYWSTGFYKRRLEMPKSDGYKNLKLGSGWNKGQDSRIKIICKNCKKIFKRYEERIKTENNFCSIKCKAEGMSKGLTKDMRKGTAKFVSEIIKYYKRKFYKYRVFDRKRGFKIFNGDVKKFLNLIKKGKCFYCDDKNKLGFDRIDNKKGHTANNVVICCEICNMTRGDRFTVEEMKKFGEIIKKIKTHRFITEGL